MILCYLILFESYRMSCEQRTPNILRDMSASDMLLGQEMYLKNVCGTAAGVTSMFPPAKEFETEYVPADQLDSSDACYYIKDGIEAAGPGCETNSQARRGGRLRIKRSGYSEPDLKCCFPSYSGEYKEPHYDSTCDPKTKNRGYCKKTGSEYCAKHLDPSDPDHKYCVTWLFVASLFWVFCLASSQ